MKRILLFSLVMWSVTTASAQNVGIGTSSPGTKLDVSGAVTYRETTVTVSSNAATIPSNVTQVRLTGTATATITLTAPTPPNPGQVLTINNNTTGGYGATLSSVTVPNGQIIDFVYSNSSWMALSGAPTATTVSNTVNLAGNTISTTVNGTTGTAVTPPNIYSTDGTLAGIRTITLGTNNLVLNTSGGGNVVIGSGDNTANPSTTGTIRAPNAGSGNTTGGGSLSINGGYGYSGTAGGSVFINGGTTSGSGTNGNVYMRGGYTSPNEGAVYLNDDHGGGVFIGSGTGMLKTTSGLVSIANAGTDYQAPITAGAGLYYSSSNTLASYWTYSSSGNTLTNNNTGNLVISTTEVVGTGDAGGSPGTGAIRGPNAGSGNASGGGLTINAGYAFGSGTGGNVTIAGGTTGTGTNGNTILRGGYSNSAEGYVLLNDDHSGKVGVGTSTPQTQMEVTGGTTDLLKVTSTTGGAGNHAYIDFSTFATAGNNYVDARIGAIDMGSNNGSLVFETGNQGTSSSTTTERMRILNTGYIGMGITVPASNLHVLASSGQGIIIDAPSGSQGLMFYSGGSSTASGTQKGALSLAGAAGAWSADAAANDLVLRSTSNRILLNTNGGSGNSSLAVNGSLVGVGTTSPAVKLHVIASSNTDGILIQNTAGGGGAAANLYFETYSGESLAGADIAGVDDGSYSAHLTFSTRVPGSSSNSLTERMRLSSSGYLGIGTTSPGYPLDVEIATSGSAIGGSSYGYLNNGGAGRGSSTTGNVGIYCSQRILTGAEYDANSDSRIKKNIRHASAADMLRLANALQVAHYNYIDQLSNGCKLKTGFIAQEVEAVLPDAVNKDPGYIPDVFVTASRLSLSGQTLTVTTPMAHGLHIGSEVRLFDGTNKEYKVIVADVIDSASFVIHDWSGPADQLFVYGQKVNDLRNVDFDQITAVAIGSVQELSRHVSALEEENRNLREMNSKLQLQNSSIQSDVDKLKASVETLQQVIGVKAEK